MSSKENVFKNLDNIVISSGKKFVAVKLLTQETVYFGVEKKCEVNELFSKICVHLGLSDCAELFGLAIRQINFPTSLFAPLTSTNFVKQNSYSVSEIEESIKQDDTQFEEEYIFLNPNAKLSKYTTKQWKNSKNGLDSMGKAYLQCFFRVQFYVDSYLFITDRVARHHYYLQLRQNVINYNLANLTLERAFLLTSIALQAEKGNYNERQPLKSTSSILNSTFLNAENQFKDLHNDRSGRCYFDPYDYMPKWIINLCENMDENYIIQNMPTMHKEQNGLNRADAEILFIKEASEICSHNLHMYRLYKTNPSSFTKKVNTVNSHFNAFFHGHHFNSSINSNSSHSSTMTNHSSSISNSILSSSSSNHSQNSSTSKEGSKVWLAISATGVQLFEQDKQIFLNKSSSFIGGQNQSSNQEHLIKDQLQDQPTSSVFFLRNKLSTFNWSDIEKLFFDKKKFEIRSNGYPIRKFTYYTHSDEMAKNLLWLCKFSHRFQLFIQPKLKEMKKRESELSRRKYRESYIYSEADSNENKLNSSANKKTTDKLRINSGWMKYEQEPTNKCLVFNNDSNSLSVSQNTLVGKESLNSSQNRDYHHLSPLSEEMQPIMDKFDKQISKLQFNSHEDNLIDLSTSNLLASNNLSTNLSINSDLEKSIKTDKLNKSIDQVDFMSSLDKMQFYNQLNTNPFIDKADYNQMTNYHMYNQQNLDEFVIEHKEDYNESNTCQSNQLTVQPSNQIEQNSLKIKINEKAISPRIETLQLTNDKPSAKQTFSLESLTCSNLSEPSSSGISEQEFSTSSCASANLIDQKNNSSNSNPTSNHQNDYQKNESPNSMQSRCSSNTSYSSDSALGNVQKSSIINPIKKKINKQINCIQKLKNYAYSVNDLHKKENYFATINNNHLLENFNDDETNNEVFNQMPKPRTRKSKFELKNKNKLTNIYKSLPNVNDLPSDSSRFGRLDLPNNGLIENERFNFLNRSDSTSSEQSVSTIKSNNRTNSSSKLNHNKDEKEQHHPNYNQNSFNEMYRTVINQDNLRINQDNFRVNQDNFKFNQDNFKFNQDNFRVNQDNFRINQEPNAIKKAIHIYENLPFQKSANNLLNGLDRTPTCLNSTFVPVPNLITTTPNRIATKIGVSSLNRCNKVNSPHHSAQKNHNYRLNLFNSNLDKPNQRTCSYQLLNNQNLSTINDPNQSTPFKTARASSDPGVLTYSSTGDLLKMNKDSCVFYQNSPKITRTGQLNFGDYQMNHSSISTNAMFHRSLNSVNDENSIISNSIGNNLAYDQPLINQINSQRKMSSNKKNQNFPMRYESEMNLISSSDQQHFACLPPPSDYASYSDKKQQTLASNAQLLMNGRLKATSEQQLNTIGFANHRNLKTNLLTKQTDSIDNLQQLKQKSHDLDLPLITALFNDRSLMLPKTVPSCSRQTHQKPKRYSLHLENSTSDLQSNLSSIESNLEAHPKPYHQTNLDDTFDETNLHLKYDNNYNNLESNNLNKLSTQYKLSQNSRAQIIDKIWSDHFLN